MFYQLYTMYVFVYSITWYKHVIRFAIIACFLALCTIHWNSLSNTATDSPHVQPEQGNTSTTSNGGGQRMQGQFYVEQSSGVTKVAYMQEQKRSSPQR